MQRNITRKPQHQHLSEAGLSLELLMFLFSYLLPEDIAQFVRINKEFRSLIFFKFDGLWESKMKLHSYDFLHGISMFQQFKNAYQERYEKIKPYAYHFSMVIEGDARLFKSNRLKDPDGYYETDNKNNFMKKMASEKNQQSMLDTIYLATEREFERAEKPGSAVKLCYETDKKIHYGDYTILGTALLCQQPFDFILELLSQGSSFDELYVDYNRPIHLVACHYHSPDVLANLLKRFPLHLNIRNAFEYSPVMYACLYGRDRLVDFLLKQKGIDIRGLTRQSKNILDLAVDSGNANCLKLILRFNQENNIFSANEIHAGCIRAMNINANIEMLKLLGNYLQLEANDKWISIFHAACANSNIELAKHCIMNMTTEAFTTRRSERLSALDLAIGMGKKQVEIIRLLLETIQTKYLIADERIWNMLTQSYRLAKKPRQFQLAALLLQYFPQLASDNNQEDRFLLDLANKTNQKNAIEFLMIKRPDVKVDFYRQILLARDIGNHELIQVLSDYYVDMQTSNIKFNKSELNALNDYLVIVYTNMTTNNITGNHVAESLRGLVFYSGEQKRFSEHLQNFKLNYAPYLSDELKKIYLILEEALESKAGIGNTTNNNYRR